MSQFGSNWKLGIVTWSRTVKLIVLDFIDASTIVEIRWVSDLNDEQFLDYFMCFEQYNESFICIAISV